MAKKSETEQPLIRNGKACKVLPDGNPRRMSDGRNAVRKMSPEQLAQFTEWMRSEGYL